MRRARGWRHDLADLDASRRNAAFVQMVARHRAEQATDVAGRQADAALQLLTLVQENRAGVFGE